MTDIVGSSAQSIIDQSIDFVLDRGEDKEIWGGTIPEEFGSDGPNDHERDMIEWIGGFSYRLTNPRRRWSMMSNHWPGITLREVEDDLFSLNPGMVHRYSRVYPEWIKENGEDRYPHTYGERIFDYGINTLHRDDDIPTPDRCENVTYSDNEPIMNQWESAVSHLRKNPSSRKANIVIWDPHVDTAQIHNESNAYVPCNIRLHPQIRGGELWMTVSCRSKDILRGATENLFEFTLLQELMANQLDVDVGQYVCHIDNIHIYREQIDDGYLDQQCVDPYEKYPDDQINSDPWETDITDRFEEIDRCLLEDDMREAMRLTESIDDDYWSSWKQALVIEWIRMRDETDEDLYRRGYEQIDSAWQISLTRRADSAFEGDWMWGEIPFSRDDLPSF